MPDTGYRPVIVPFQRDTPFRDEDGEMEDGEIGGYAPPPMGDQRIRGEYVLTSQPRTLGRSMRGFIHPGRYRFN